MPRRPGSSSVLPAPPVPAVHLRAEHARSDVTARVRSGSWTRARRGAYVDSAPGCDGRVDARLALARLVAVHRQSARPPVFVRESAALVWGLPLVAPPGLVHVAQSTRPSGGSARDVLRHVVDVPQEYRVTHRGFRVTTLERTLVDCAATLDPYAGLVVADAALHRGADRDRVLAILEESAGRRGVRRARAVVEAADGGAESPGETWLRWTLLRLGLPTPETQVLVRTRSGRYWADLGYPAARLLLEYDGAEKYGRDGVAAVEALRRERRRQLAVEDAGWRVLRATSADRSDPHGLVARVRALLPPAPLIPRPDLQPPLRP
ncbi:hypothetical protein [Cellulomonas telluris]|uniref:hypothetical protein n=1 Tax=Cellulomonas telluris TaxID=2306636 RepID=UPI0010A8D2ED|nr:hypothetical protein [Cellulomonas telluris]